MVEFSKGTLSAICISAAAALGGCAAAPPDRINQGPVNTGTRYEPANANPVVKMSRCEDKGILVVDGNRYNMDQFRRNNGWMFRRDSGMSSEMVATGQGPKMMFYPSPVQQNNPNTGTAIAGIGGAVAGSHVGGGRGRDAATAVGALAAAAILGPVIQGSINGVTRQFQRVGIMDIAECRQDLTAIYGAPNYAPQQRAPRQSPYDFNPYTR